MPVARHWRKIPERYRLESSKCKQCGYISFPKRIVCPECGTTEFENIILSGKGKLVTYTIIRVAPEGFGDQAPYAIGIVELDEGRLTEYLGGYSDYQAAKSVSVEDPER